MKCDKIEMIWVENSELNLDASYGNIFVGGIVPRIIFCLLVLIVLRIDCLRTDVTKLSFV